MTSDAQGDRWIVVGRVVRAHGLKGELGVRCDDPASSSLLEVKSLRLVGETATRKIVSARAANVEVLLRVEGVNDRNAAELLKGKDVEIRRADLPAPEAGEFYQADLIGLMAVDESGKPLGRVQGFWETGPVPVIVIGEGALELLVPFAEHFVVAVKQAEGQVVIRPPEYTE
ncbi:MAG: 16S rRNA processing protein RimM [Deltaproteobacteria bacterium]|nr:16S rRNA processing protein RimM [Deltaproteobacteria bacterium]